MREGRFSPRACPRAITYSRYAPHLVPCMATAGVVIVMAAMKRGSSLCEGCGVSNGNRAVTCKGCSKLLITKSKRPESDPIAHKGKGTFHRLHAFPRLSSVEVKASYTQHMSCVSLLVICATAVSSRRAVIVKQSVGEHNGCSITRWYRIQINHTAYFLVGLLHNLRVSSQYIQLSNSSSIS